MGKFADIIGQKFGRLTVVSLDKKLGNNWLYRCQCECGGETSTRPSHLKTGQTSSCGCLARENAGIASKYRHERNRESGVYTTTSTNKRRVLHKVWCSMRERCNNLNAKRYGAIGITYCPSWESFEVFYENMQDGFSFGLTLDRIDGSKGYYKENCRWATRVQQQRNLSTNRLVLFRGTEMTVAELSEISGINYRTLIGRLNRGWDAERAAALTPLRTYTA